MFVVGVVVIASVVKLKFVLKVYGRKARVVAVVNRPWMEEKGVGGGNTGNRSDLHSD